MPLANDVTTRAPGEPRPPEPRGWTDALSTMDGPELWAREIEKEEARNRRYRRTASIAVAEIEGYGGVAATYGHTAALEAFGTVCQIVRDEIRASDYAARIGPTRLAFLLVEAADGGAATFVERVQTVFERAVGPGREMTITFGCATPSRHETLADAVVAATQRLAARLAGIEPVPDERPAEADRNRDPWADLEGAAAAATRRRQTVRARMAFGAAAVADVMAAAAWVLTLGGVVRFVPH